jgi:hypothetical protein
LPLGLAAVLLLAVPALAQDAGCAPASEVLGWTSQVVADIALSDGPATQMHAKLLLEATNRADEAAAGWPESYHAVLAELGYLAATVADNGGKADSAEAGAISDYGASLAGTATIRCGIDVVPATPVRPVGDAAACPRVIDALTRLKEVLPAISRGGGGMSGAPILAASVTLKGAVADATAAGWAPDTLKLLATISDDVAAISGGKAQGTPAVAAALVGIGVGVELDARAICLGQDVPRLAAAS